MGAGLAAECDAAEGVELVGKGDDMAGQAGFGERHRNVEAMVAGAATVGSQADHPAFGPSSGGTQGVYA